MPGKGKRIGYVDLALDNFHANTYLKLLRNELKDRGYTVAGCIALEEKEGKAWAKQNDVPYFDTPDALNEAVDHYVVLAPSNPEVHLKLCQMVFPFGKPTYVDKTFAQNLTTAEGIFDLARKHRVPMQTTSALRYTNVQDYVREVGPKEVRHMVTWGGGSSFGEYAIHPVELAVSCMGPGAKRLMRRGTGDHAQLLIDFTNNRSAVVNVYTNQSTPYAASVTTKKGTRLLPVESARIFLNMAVAILDMFDSGRPSIDRKESLIIRRILDVAGQKDARQRFVDL